MTIERFLIRIVIRSCSYCEVSEGGSKHGRHFEDINGIVMEEHTTQSDTITLRIEACLATPFPQSIDLSRCKLGI